MQSRLRWISFAETQLRMRLVDKVQRHEQRKPVGMNLLVERCKSDDEAIVVDSTEMRLQCSHDLGALA